MVHVFQWPDFSARVYIALSNAWYLSICCSCPQVLVLLLSSLRPFSVNLSVSFGKRQPRSNWSLSHVVLPARARMNWRNCCSRSWAPWLVVVEIDFEIGHVIIWWVLHRLGLFYDLTGILAHETFVLLILQLLLRILLLWCPAIEREYRWLECDLLSWCVYCLRSLFMNRLNSSHLIWDIWYKLTLQLLHVENNNRVMTVFSYLSGRVYVLRRICVSTCVFENDMLRWC